MSPIPAFNSFQMNPALTPAGRTDDSNLDVLEGDLNHGSCSSNDLQINSTAELNLTHDPRSVEEASCMPTPPEPAWPATGMVPTAAVQDEMLVGMVETATCLEQEGQSLHEMVRSLNARAAAFLMASRPPSYAVSSRQ